MKRLLLFAIVTIFGLGFTQAQEFNFGLKGGVNLASISGDETDEVDGLTSFHAGVLAEILVSERFSIQPELIYSIQGAKAEYSETFQGEIFEENYTMNLNYVNLPILFKYYITENLSIEAGPQVGYLISADNEYEWTEYGETGSETEDNLEYMNRIDLAAAAGLSYKFDFGVFLSARYNAGLSNIYDSEDFSDYSNQNSVIQFSIGFML